MSISEPASDEIFWQMVELLIYLRNSKRVDSVDEPTIKAVSLVMRVTQRPRKQAREKNFGALQSDVRALSFLVAEDLREN